ncbi:hypothetical protein [Metapseudomonas otitidis]|uniref:hypothetical protein n=1 Tax=Metapseudomonas otitidis TaxID=319939 RepID=UPI0013F5DADC|nr:hypothetical protein [Pseudomonas otitidis]
MKKVMLALALLATTAHAEDFDMKSYVDSAYQKGDSVPFKCVEADGSFDSLHLYGEEEMLWTRYVGGEPVARQFVKPRISKDKVVIPLESAYEGASERVFTFVAKEGNKVTWNHGKPCTVSL